MPNSNPNSANLNDNATQTSLTQQKRKWDLAPNGGYLSSILYHFFHPIPRERIQAEIKSGDELIESANREIEKSQQTRKESDELGKKVRESLAQPKI